MKNLLRGVSRDDLEALSNFLRANGITENAADSSTSPLWTAELSLTSALSTDESSSPNVDNIRLFCLYFHFNFFVNILWYSFMVIYLNKIPWLTLFKKYSCVTIFKILAVVAGTGQVELDRAIQQVNRLAAFTKLLISLLNLREVCNVIFVTNYANLLLTSVIKIFWSSVICFCLFQ